MIAVARLRRLGLYPGLRRATCTRLWATTPDQVRLEVAGARATCSAPRLKEEMPARKLRSLQ